MNEVSSLPVCHSVAGEMSNPQVEHIIQKLTKPREYYPPDDEPQDLGPTEGCKQAIKCLKMHCQLLKGSTSKEVLEVFYQEIGIRLIASVIHLCVNGRG